MEPQKSSFQLQLYQNIHLRSLCKVTHIFPSIAHARIRSSQLLCEVGAIVVPFPIWENQGTESVKMCPRSHSWKCPCSDSRTVFITSKLRNVGSGWRNVPEVSSAAYFKACPPEPCSLPHALKLSCVSLGLCCPCISVYGEG